MTPQKIKPYKIKLNKLKPKQYRNIVTNFSKLGYYMYTDYNFNNTPINKIYNLIIYNPKILKDKNVKIMLLEYLI